MADLLAEESDAAQPCRPVLKRARARRLVVRCLQNARSLCESFAALDAGADQALPQPASRISRRREAVRANSKLPSPSIYSRSGSSAALAISRTCAS